MNPLPALCSRKVPERIYCIYGSVDGMDHGAYNFILDSKLFMSSLTINMNAAFNDFDKCKTAGFALQVWDELENGRRSSCDH